jgi:prepilin-type N-terminal cleavage/methylation domain-containing protein
MNKTKFFAFSLIELSIVILIIGILVAGVTEGSRLISNAKLSSARTLTKSSDVNSIKDLILWIDASAEGKLINTSGLKDVKDNDFIKSWSDQNSQLPTPLFFTTSTANTYPVFRQNALNNLPAIEFDGVNDFLGTPDEPRIAKPNNHTIFAVLSLISGHNTDSLGVIAKQTGSFPNTPYSLTIDGMYLKVTTVVTDESGANANNYLESNTVTFVDNSPIIAAVTQNSVSTTTGLKTYLNGRIANQVNTVSSIASSGGYLKIGQQKDGATARFCKCYISEIIMYDRVLSSEERKSIEKYLSKKWGIKIVQ